MLATVPDLDLLRSPHDTHGLVDAPAPTAAQPALNTLATQIAEVTGVPAPTRGPAERWLATQSGVRYPVLAGIPLLMADYAHDAAGPLGATAGVSRQDLDHYTAVSLREAAAVESSPVLAELRALGPSAPGRAGDGQEDDDALGRRWVDAPYDGPAQLRCYTFLRPVLRGGTAAQVGGSGTHALKFLLAGAGRAVAVSPIVGELVFAVVLARALGLTDRLVAVAGTGEDLPLAAGSVDALYCGGTLHHMDTALAGREFARVLSPRGRFAAAEPWKVPLLHHAGTRLLGKREPTDCRPIDPARLTALRGGFGGQVDDRRHGAFIRYPALALGKAGIRPSTPSLLRMMLREDALGLPGSSSLGSSLSLTGQSVPAPRPSTD